MKNIDVDIPDPKKQKFSVELDLSPYTKTVADVIKPSAIIVDVKYQNQVVDRSQIFISGEDKTGKYKVDEDEDEDFGNEEYGEEEEQEEFEEEEEEEQDAPQQPGSQAYSFEQLADIELTPEILATFVRSVKANFTRGRPSREVARSSE